MSDTKYFKIVKVYNSDWNVLVIATTPFDPLEQINEIELELQKLPYEGTVLFDYLSYNGNKYNRFISYEFDGNRIDLLSSSVVKNDRMDSPAFPV